MISAHLNVSYSFIIPHTNLQRRLQASQTPPKNLFNNYDNGAQPHRPLRSRKPRTAAARLAKGIIASVGVLTFPSFNSRNIRYGRGRSDSVLYIKLCNYQACAFIIRFHFHSPKKTYRCESRAEDLPSPSVFVRRHLRGRLSCRCRCSFFRQIKLCADRISGIETC